MSGRVAGLLARVEDVIAAAALLLMGAIPVVELGLRTFAGTGIPGASDFTQNITLWVAFTGAMVAARRQRHLNLSVGVGKLPLGVQRVGRTIAALIATCVAASLAWAGFDFVRYEIESPMLVGDLFPIWVIEAIMPLAFAAIALRFIGHAGNWLDRGIAFLGIPLAALIGFALEGVAPQLVWPGIALLIAAAVFGAPIFVVLGGSALLLFYGGEDPLPASSIPVETYRLVVSPAIPTIPLFTLTGFLLAESGAGTRLLRLFRALVGWLPGGLALVAILMCAFFTTFTGASGVAILALGGLLLPMLLESGYRERFSLGLLTATGSIGLLFPPSLAVIVYGVAAHVPIPDLFIAGIIPGILLLVAAGVLGVREGLVAKAPRQPFSLREVLAALWLAKWEVLLPVVTLGGIFGGFCTLIEAAALTAVYTLVIEVVVQRDLHPTRDLPRVLTECVTLVGGVFVILGVAMGLSSYLIFADVPTQAADWVQANVGSRWVFLICLNVFLLLVGCLMDIFSAIVVVVPLIAPIAAAYQIHPVHLGMIFLVNLELGYLTPPVGMNLFLAAYRFERPVVLLYRCVLPFLLVFLLVVLLVTYVPSISTAFLGD